MHAQEDLKRRELEKDRSKMAYQEVKARYRQAEESLRVIRDRCDIRSGDLTRTIDFLYASCSHQSTSDYALTFNPKV